MKMHSTLNGTIRKNGRYLLFLFGFCGLIPHLILSLLQIASASDNWSPSEIESFSNFFVCQWTPFWAAFLSYLRLQKQDNFSLLPTISFVLILPTFLPRFQQASILTLALMIPLLLLVEITALLKNAEDFGSKILAAISADRKLLRAFFFWSIAFLCMALISSEACTWYTTVVSPFLMLPIPGVLMIDVFRQQKDRPPTVWSLIGMLLMVPLSLYLATIGPMERFQAYHLISLGAGFSFLFFMLIVYNFDQWKKQSS